MARKTKTVTGTFGRDAGKQYLITEMSGDQTEDWALRAFLALASSGVEIPDDLQDMGMAGIASLSLTAIAGIKWDFAKPLLDEMMACVQVMPDKSNPANTRPIFKNSDDIEEVATRLMLRKEVFGLHMDFSALAPFLRSGTAGQAPGEE